MPIHDWTRVEDGIFHHFHHSWIEEIARTLNRGMLPGDYYAMAEQFASGSGPDVLTLQGPTDDEEDLPAESAPSSVLTLAPPKARMTGESEREFYRRKQNIVAVRHVTGDRVVAMVGVVSPGNKSSRRALRAFVEKASEMLDRRVHLLILDLIPPGPRDPNGIHAAIWEEYTGFEYAASAAEPLTFVAYESSETVRAFVEPASVGDELPDMPLFLRPRAHVLVPLETTYRAAYGAFPARWRKVLEGGTAPR
ncbi:MAG TPA: DUF4058 family protein [Isosphaeraceae bacterium]